MRHRPRHLARDTRPRARQIWTTAQAMVGVGIATLAVVAWQPDLEAVEGTQGFVEVAGTLDVLAPPTPPPMIPISALPGISISSPVLQTQRLFWFQD